MLVTRFGLALIGVIIVAPGRVAAEEPAVPGESGPRAPNGDLETQASDPAPGDAAYDASLEDSAEEYRALARPPGRAGRLVGTLAIGQGLRFNNPYRLQAQLGDDARSLSLTPGYLDLGAAFALGPADGLQHGGALHFSAALAGVGQQSLTPSYFVAYQGPGRVLGYGRLGAVLLTAPDVNVGGELAMGLGYFLTARLALSGELVGDLFYGAGTYEATYTVIPVLSAQVGIMIAHELLP